MTLMSFVTEKALNPVRLLPSGWSERRRLEGSSKKRSYLSSNLLANFGLGSSRSLNDFLKLRVKYVFMTEAF